MISKEEAFDLLERLFPDGLQSDDLLKALCPEGWQKSSLRLFFHPSEERLGKAKFEHLMGLCLWDILSDNHELIFPDGRIVHLGSRLGAAGIIGEYYDLVSDEDHLEFYLGAQARSSRTNLGPIYGHIFSRLRDFGIDWKYSFPGIISFDKFDNAGAEIDHRSASISAEDEEESDPGVEQEMEELEGELEELHREAIEQARHEPPPATVQAYHRVFGKWPSGWPPWE